MDSDKTPSETVPMTQLNHQNSNDNMITAPSSPTLSQTSISVTNRRHHSQTTLVDVPIKVPFATNTINDDQSPFIVDLTSNINSMLNGSLNENDPNAEVARTESDSRVAPKGFNRYRTGKTFSQGLWDLTLLVTNLMQLKALIYNKSEKSSFEFYFLVIFLVLSIILQITVGLLLLLSERYNVKKEDERKTVYKMGTYVVVCVLFISIINVIIVTFYYDNPGEILLHK